MNRRDTLKFLAGATAFAGSAAMLGRGIAFAQAKPFTLPPLGYANEALEPHIDAKTMQIHHDNHHGAFINNLNNNVDKWSTRSFPILRPYRKACAASCATISAAIGTTRSSGS